jgi:hypothetical protein
MNVVIGSTVTSVWVLACEAPGLSQSRSSRADPESHHVAFVRLEPATVIKAHRQSYPSNPGGRSAGRQGVQSLEMLDCPGLDRQEIRTLKINQQE